MPGHEMYYQVWKAQFFIFFFYIFFKFLSMHQSFLRFYCTNLFYHYAFGVRLVLSHFQ